MGWKKASSIISLLIFGVFMVTGLLIVYYDLMGKLTGLIGFNQLLLAFGFMGVTLSEIFAPFVLSIPYDVILMTAQWDLILIMTGIWAVSGIVMGAITKSGLWGFLSGLFVMIGLAVVNMIVFNVIPLLGLPIDLNSMIIGMTSRDLFMFIVSGTIENGILIGTFGLLIGSIIERATKKDDDEMDVFGLYGSVIELDSL